MNECWANCSSIGTVVNDSGVYLPVSSHLNKFALLCLRTDVSQPSPPEKKSFWPRRSNPSGTSTGARDSESEIEAFSISRESFDSYRRSFVGAPDLGCREKSYV